eukprot:6198396-Pleurochrysis_carterae.AAC.1
MRRPVPYRVCAIPRRVSSGSDARKTTCTLIIDCCLATNSEHCANWGPAAPPKMLLDLPDVVIEHIAAIGGLAVVLPQVCKQLQRVCTSDAVQALRISQRICMVADAVREDARRAAGIGEWEAGHAWAVTSDLHSYVCSGASQSRVQAIMR